MYHVILNSLSYFILVLIIILIVSFIIYKLFKLKYPDQVSIKYFLGFIIFFLSLVYIPTGIYLIQSMDIIKEMSISIENIVDELPSSMSLQYQYSFILLESEEDLTNEQLIEIGNKYTEIQDNFYINLLPLKIKEPNQTRIISDNSLANIDKCLTTNGYITGGEFLNGQAILTICNNLQDQEIEVADATYDKYTLGELKSINIK